MSTTVLFIHGAWLTPRAWDPFRGHFEAQGFRTLAPPWPYMDAPIDELRRRPSSSFGTLTVESIVEYYAAKIRALPDAPVLVGHSYGGLFTQLLLDRGLGVAGVALDPVPIAGVLPSPRALWSAFPALLQWGSWKRAVSMSFNRFTADFAQTLPDQEKRAAFDQFIVPAPGRLYWQAALGLGNAIRRGNTDRPPLLLIGGEADQTITPSMVRAAYARQRKSPSATELRMFPGRSHFLLAEPGWEEVADAAIGWAKRFGEVRSSAARLVERPLDPSPTATDQAAQ